MTNQELLKVYSSYLPYGVKLVDDEYKDVHTLFTVCSNNSIVVKNNEDKDFEVLIYGDFKLLLRPLSDLTKEIEHNGEKFVPVQKIRGIFIEIDGSHRHFDFPLTIDGNNCGVQSLSYWVLQQFLEWHFDIFGLIPQNLAINLNEVK